MANQGRIYMIIGSTQHQADTAIDLARNLSVSFTKSSIICASALDKASFSTGLEQWQKSTTEKSNLRRLLLLKDLHQLDDSNTKNLDFIFESTDSYRRIQNMIVLLLSNFFHDEEIDTSDWSQNDWRQQILSRFSSSDQRFNAYAFTGRIQKFIVGSRRNDSQQTISEPVCSRFQKLIEKGSKRQVDQTLVYPGFKFTIEAVYGVLAAFLLPVLYCHYIILSRRLS